MKIQPRNKPIGHYIKKDNELTKARFHDMSVTAYRIILMASSDKFIDQIKDNPLDVIYITPADYHDLYGTGGDSSAAYKALKGTQEELIDAKLCINNKVGGRDGYVAWLTRAIYDETTKAMEIRFSVDVLPLILDVERNFTYYNLRNIAKLSSMHSIRLYELMMFWRKKGTTPPLSISYMRAWLGVGDEKYPEAKDFNKHVIKKSVEEISEKTDIKLEFTPQKEGRTTVGYTFNYTPKISQTNENGEDESYGQSDPPGKFPPPSGADDEDAELPF